MKKIIGIMTFISLVFVGCSQFENNITEPEINTLSETIDTVNNIHEDSLTSVFASKEIDGAIGGQITILQDVVDSTGRIINIYADLIVPIGAYQGIKTIRMGVNWKTASIKFYPSMQFDSSLTFHSMFTGLPLAQMGFQNGDTVEFVYIDKLGNTYPVLNKEVSMNYNFGRLRVNNAKIQHFSRYGFVRRAI